MKIYKRLKVRTLELQFNLIVGVHDFVAAFVQ